MERQAATVIWLCDRRMFDVMVGNEQRRLSVRNSLHGVSLCLSLSLGVE